MALLGRPRSSTHPDRATGMPWQAAPSALGAQWPVRMEIQPPPLPALCLEGGTLSVCTPLGWGGQHPESPRVECPNALSGWGHLPGPPSLPAPQGRTLLEAKMGHPLDGRVSLLHELVEADQEGVRLLPLLLLRPLPACLVGGLGEDQEAGG